MRGQPMTAVGIEIFEVVVEGRGRCVRGVRGGEKKKERRARQTKDERGIKENSQLSIQMNHWTTEFRVQRTQFNHLSTQTHHAFD